MNKNTLLYIAEGKGIKARGMKPYKVDDDYCQVTKW